MKRFAVRAMGMAIGLAVAAAASAQQGTVQEPAKPRLVCKRTVETGSLVGKRRECRTKYDWDRIAEAARMGGQDLIDRGMSRPGGR